MESCGVLSHPFIVGQMPCKVFHSHEMKHTDGSGPHLPFGVQVYRYLANLVWVFIFPMYACSYTSSVRCTCVCIPSDHQLVSQNIKIVKQNHSSILCLFCHVAVVGFEELSGSKCSFNYFI